MTTLWLLVSSTYVFFMIVGLAFFYGGLVRKKNILNTLMMSFISVGIVALTWSLIGYSLAYADGNDFFGGMNYALLNNINMEGEDFPKIIDFIFQATFAIITAALISGAVVERMNFKAYMIFITIWSIIVYAPMAKWVWGGGLFDKLPTGSALDFAGGTVVHINAAVTALVLALVIGKRKDLAKIAIIPHQVPFTLLGAGILWFGWFGFNGGSAYAVNGIAALAVANTLLAPAATIVAWIILDYLFTRKITAVGLATSIIVGLVAITPAAGLVSPVSAILIGVIACFPCYFMIMWRSKTGIDDSLDVFGAHGLGGIVGSILTGVFVSQAWGADIDGSFNQVISQCIAVVIAVIYSGVMSFLIAKFISCFMSLRVSDTEERQGLDLSMHGEEGYSDGEGAILLTANDSSMVQDLIALSSSSDKKGILRS
jgi:ammonium transporter, Amt family